MRFLFASVIFLAVAVFGLQQSEILSAQNIRVKGEKRADISTVVQMVRISDDEINKYLGIGQNLLRPSFELIICIDSADNHVGSIFASGRLDVNSSDNYIYTLYNIIRIQLVRRARQLTGENSWRDLMSVDWLAAAICHRIAFAGKGIRWNYQPDYSRQMRMYNQNKFPDLSMMLDNPPPLSEQNFFLVYLLHCDAFAFCLEEVKPDCEFFRQLFAMEYLGRSSYEALSLLMASNFSSKENLQFWFQRVAKIKCTVGHTQNSVADIRRSLKKLLTIPVSGNSSGIELVDIRQLPERFVDYRPDRNALEILKGDILELRNGAPLLMLDSLSDYAVAIDVLIAGDRGGFIKAMNAADESFAEAESLLARISMGLNAAEDSGIIPSHTLEQLQIYDKYHSLEYQL